jgi:four helix bundle protein
MGSREAREAEEAREAQGKPQRVAVQRSAGPIRHYKDLLVFQKAYSLALRVSRLSRSFPREEQFELGRQIRRASRSVAANIVEGWAKRHSPAEFKRHLQVSIGECAETRFWLELVADEGCAARASCEELEGEYARLGMLLQNLWKEWRKLA